MDNNATAHWLHWPQAWYVVAHSESIKPGQVHTGHLADRQWVVYRTQAGVLQAMAAFCPHMGAHLQSAQVVGDALVCGLHACHIYPQSKSQAVAGKTSIQCMLSEKKWPCVERFGLIWLHPPTASTPPLPFDNIATSYHWLGGLPQLIGADWRAMICNGFDLGHMQVVHQREVLGQPLFERLSEGSLRMTYRTRVLQDGGFSSWLMNKLSGGYIELVHTCNSSNIMVQSRVGRFQSVGIFALLPQDSLETPPEHRQTLAFASVGLPQKTRFVKWKLKVVRWLYLSFLKKDLVVVKGMRMCLDDVEDVGVQAVATYQKTLNSMEIEEGKL